MTRIAISPRFATRTLCTATLTTCPEPLTYSIR